MSTLKSFQTHELSPRKKLRYFQFAALRAARILYYGGYAPGATGGVLNESLLQVAKGSLPANYGATDSPHPTGYQAFALIQGLYSRPWRKSKSSSEVLASVYAQGKNYKVGDVLTAGSSGPTFLVAGVNKTGGVRAVVVSAVNSGHAGGTNVQTTGGSGDGKCTLNLRAALAATIDVLDQVRIDMEKAYGAVAGEGVKNGRIVDWGGTVLRWLVNPTGALNLTGITGWVTATAQSVGSIVSTGTSTLTYWKCIASETTITDNESPATPDTAHWVQYSPAMYMLDRITARLAAITAE